jgi:hypothetical protein
MGKVGWGKEVKEKKKKEVISEVKEESKMKKEVVKRAKIGVLEEIKSKVKEETTPKILKMHEHPPVIKAVDIVSTRNDSHPLTNTTTL